MEQAGRDLASATGRRSIILVSDGEETCGRNPCEVAATLASRGVDVRIDVVGLGVQGSTRNQLQCIAKVGRGTYTDASDTDDLTSSLERARRRAAEPFQVTGSSIAGSDSVAGAPTMAAGTWTDTLPRSGRTKYYALSRTMARSTFWVGATAWPKLPRRSLLATTGLKIRSVTDEWGTCGSSVLTSWAIGDRQSTMMWGGVSSAGSAQDAEQCATHRLVVEVSVGEDDPLAGTPIQLTVLEEPPVDDRALPPATPQTPVTWTPMRHARATPVAASTSLAEAPRIGAGTHSFDIAPGEARLVRVPVGWGQRLQVLVISGRLPEQDRLSSTDELGVRVVAPTGGQASAELGSSPGSVTGKGRLGGHVLTAGTHEVRYLNRHSTEETVAATGMPGDYFVMVTLDRSSDTPQIALPITVTVATLGTAGTGAPTYEHPTPPRDSASPAPTREATGSPSPRPTTGAGVPGSQRPESDDGRARAGARTWGLLGGLLGGVVGLGLLVAGYSLWHARRTGRP